MKVTGSVSLVCKSGYLSGYTVDLVVKVRKPGNVFRSTLTRRIFNSNLETWEDLDYMLSDCVIREEAEDLVRLSLCSKNIEEKITGINKKKIKVEVEIDNV